jgi:hypothetical protein
MKLPPDLNQPTVNCPKCGRENRVPTAEFATVGAVVEAAAEAEARAAGQAPGLPPADATGGVYEYVRKGGGWESFACGCGNLLQLSPGFRGSVLSCKRCGKNTVIKQ